METTLERPAEAAASAAQVPAIADKPATQLTIQATLLARFAAIEPAIVALAARYDRVAFDVSTPAGLAEARAARHDLRENGRYFLQRSHESTKDEVNAGKKLMTTETDRLVAILKPVEDSLDAIITAREKAIADEKAERERVAAARRDRFEAEIEKIRRYTLDAIGLPATRIEKAIEFVEGLAFGTEWEEFAETAAIAQAGTLRTLRALLIDTQAAERGAAEAEARRVEAERIAREQAIEANRLKAQAEQLDALRAELERKTAELDARQAAAVDAEREAPVDDMRAAREAERTAGWEQFDREHIGAESPYNLDPLETDKREIPAIEPTRVAAPLPAASGWPHPAPVEVEATDVGPITFADPLPVVEAAPPLTIGTISTRLGFTVTQAFLATLGFAPIEAKGRAVLFPAISWVDMKAALIAHIEGLQ